MTIRKGKTIIAGNSSNGLEIGDIGLSAIGIDESLNYRRYLNGQEILQAQFPEFTKKIKRRVELYPSLACTNIEYETACTLSTHGQCGKFVIDNERGVIRLPKVVNVMGLSDMAEAGVTVEAGLPNIEGDTGTLHVRTNTGNSPSANSAIQISNSALGETASGVKVYGGIMSFDASLSNPIYGNSDTVQQEAIKYPYFIQVASSCETTINLTRDIELNNPFSLFEYKFSEYAIDNISWLESKGQWNSNKVYVSAYEELLAIYNGKVREGVSVKKTTETYTDYDFVIDEAGSTFRLPLKVQQKFYGDVAPVVGNGTALGLTDGSATVGIGESTDTGRTYVSEKFYGIEVGTKLSSGSYATANDVALGVVADESTSGLEAHLKENSTLKLYFYVGETVQDGNLINAGAVLEDVNTLKNTALTTSQITNCITEIPQRIKLELNANKSLVLKAGSEYIMPNGFEEDGVTPKFEYITADIDIQQANGHATQDVYCVRNYTSPKYLAGFHATKCFSGNTAPTGFGVYAFWYDTANNLVKWTQDSGSTWTAGYSLPICLATGTETGNVNMASIDQVFQGMGYIGSTVWVDKGVKCLMPNGRNEDGSLKNVEYITESLQLYSNTVVSKNMIFVLEYPDYSVDDNTFFDGYKYIISEQQPTDNYILWYQPSTNITAWHATGDAWYYSSMVFLGTYDRGTGGVISNFNPELPFKALGTSDSPEVSGWGMPSNKYIDLTLGASGNKYIAPANGWFTLRKIANSDGGANDKYCDMYNNTNSIGVHNNGMYGFQFICTIPALKGDIIQINYNATGNTGLFRFIYAKGEV